MAFAGIKCAIHADQWAGLGLSPNLVDPTKTTVMAGPPVIKLTPREMAGLLRWDRLKTPHAYYDMALGISLATKGVVNIEGYYANGETTLCEMMPEWMILEAGGCRDLRDGKLHAEYHAACSLTAIGKNLLKYNGLTMHDYLSQNRIADRLMEVDLAKLPMDV